jgi:hypothetical protein
MLEIEPKGKRDGEFARLEKVGLYSMTKILRN